ncbi:Phytanoyl-CoA dioxygenase family protein [Aspergillus sclerotialis]|uniref:Phytanoyl-CoA dioxygenase family protein n=1 Tax=Aspergillus sclerotialis TaxID=2070753 RepID=A0A3A2ZW06_9EURO|nr:Phytanoyl-CoA dioxygenase family protein [Aspergillus sclerotialis]
MTDISRKYGPEVQYVQSDTPFEDIIALIKRDGAVVIRSLVPVEMVDKAHAEVRDRIESDVEWDGEFFPKETRRAPSLIARSPTFTKTQLMNPLFQKICAHFLTTRTWFWWGDKQKESVSKPYVHSCTAIEIGPGAKAQPLHRDSYINHNILTEITEWNDERDRNRESAVGMMVAGCKVTKENGGTQFIPGSHLWGTNRKTPPSVEDCVAPELEKGDAVILLSSVYHGGGNNTTKDQYRLCFSTFVTRGYLRQEENQYLAVPRDVVKQYDRDIQEFIGYYMSDPACGWVEEMDPLYVLYPEKLKDVRPKDF